jgi:hypothetical protein
MARSFHNLLVRLGLGGRGRPLALRKR